MSWNYRVIHHNPSQQKVGKEMIEVGAYYAIHEVYYNDDDEPELMSADPIIIGNEIDELASEQESLNSIKWTLSQMNKALEEDPINENKFGK